MFSPDQMDVINAHPNEVIEDTYEIYDANDNWVIIKAFRPKTTDEMCKEGNRHKFGVCIFLSDNGCKLTDRPMECQLLDPKTCKPNHAKREQLLFMWQK